MTLSNPRIGKPFFRVPQPMEAFPWSGDLLRARAIVRHITSLSLRAFLCGTALSLFAASVNAQFSASLQGSVTDQSGAVIPGAVVTLTNTGTNRTLQTRSTREGFYRFSELAPGLYTITAEQTGFDKQTLDRVIVTAEETQGLDITLKTGVVTVTDTVDAQPETENANVDRVITTTEIRQLPQTARDPFNLLRLAPGVFGDAARGSNGDAVNLPNTPGPGGSNNSIFQSENQPQISAAGQRVTTNNFQLDGISINSLQWGGAAVITPNQESIKEILISSSSFSAEDGRNSGAQVKIISQNGTNEFHGSAFFKYDSPKLNAFNRYYGNSVRPALPSRVDQRYKQYGASLGGPLSQDKLFFFFSYEGLTDNSDNPYQAFVETPQYRQQVIGARPDGTTAKIFQSPGIQPRIIAILPRTCASVFGADAVNRCRDTPGGLDLGSITGARNSYLPLGDGVGAANIGGGFDGVPDVVYALLDAPSRQRGNQFNLRSDYNLNAANRLTFSSYVTSLHQLSADVGSQSRPGSDVYDKPLTYALTGIWAANLSSTTVNEFRSNFTRLASNQVQASPNTDFGIPNIQVEGVPFNQIRWGRSRAETTPAIFSQNTFELADTAIRVFGNHAVKLGASFRREFDNNQLAGGARPLYSFVGLFNLANDTPIFEAINADPTTGTPTTAQRELRSNDISVFVQDDWKLTPNLTLNLGLRYEYFSPLVDAGNRLTNLQLGTGAQTLTAAKLVHVTSFTDANALNFGPRIGFAYSPGQHTFLGHRAVIRGGFGIFYNRIPDVVFANAAANPPFFARYNICCGTAPTDFGSPFVGGQIQYALGSNRNPNSFPTNPALATGINPATGLPNTGSVEIYGAPRTLPNARIYKYSVEFQYQMPFQIVASAGYEGNQSTHLIRFLNENFLYPANPGIFAAYFATPDVTANYNGLNLQAQRRFGDYQIAVNYRFSKSLDELSNEGPGAVTNQTYPVDLRQERGPSDFDVRHNFNLSGVAALPFFRDQKTLTGKLLGGFDLSGIVTYHTGFPWTPKVGESILGAGGDYFGPVRPIAYYGGVNQDTSNAAFLQPNGYFPGGGSKYFSTTLNDDPSRGNAPSFQVNPPGIGRNTFRGPRYFDVDISVAKRFSLPRFGVLGENPNLQLRANFFNIFDTLNLAPFGFFSSGTFVNNPNFGEPDGALAGRVVELQVRIRF